MFACFAFGFHYSADFLACVFRIPLVDDIEKRGKIIVLLVCAVYAVVDSDKPHAFLHKQDFRIEADFQIVGGQSAIQDCMYSFYRLPSFLSTSFCKFSCSIRRKTLTGNDFLPS